MLATFPLLALPVALYNLLMLTLPGAFAAPGAADRLATPLVHLRMASRADWPVTLGDAILAGSLVILFAELLKSAGSRNAAIVNHGLSLILFVLCLVEFLLFPAFATSTFFLVSLMVFLDASAGFIVTVIAARREADFRAD